MRAWDKMQRKIRKARAVWSQDRIWVTIVGIIETRASMDDEVVPGPDGLQRVGFGHGGGSAAAIEVRGIEDIIIERHKPDTGYSDKNH
jgi:hypothetical protein